MATAPEKTLYERLGGYDAIAAATDELLKHLTSDPEIGNRAVGLLQHTVGLTACAASMTACNPVTRLPSNLLYAGRCVLINQDAPGHI